MAMFIAIGISGMPRNMYHFPLTNVAVLGKDWLDLVLCFCWYFF